MNKHITNYLDQYIKLKEPDFAVMINGEWGCGKTYFIKNYLKILSEKKIKVKYVSLNGITNFSDAFVQFLSGEKSNNFLKYISRLITSASFTIAGISMTNILRAEDFCSFIKNKIVVFDDFERCKIEAKELLGYLSYFTEQLHLPVIIIVNEKKVDVQEEYKQCKEKIVGKTFELDSNDTEIVPLIINSISSDSNSSIAQLLNSNLATVFQLLNRLHEYTEEKKTNYRIVKHLLEDFFLIFDPVFLDKKLSSFQTSIFVQIFPRFFIAYYLLQINHLKNYQFLRWDHLSTELDDDLKNFKAKFREWDYEYFLPTDVWENIFQNKNLDYEQLNDYILNRCSPQIENWVELWHFFDKEDLQIDEIINQTRDDLANERYTDPVTILHVFATFLEMQKNGFLWDKTKMDIVKDAGVYIQKISSKLQYSTDLAQAVDLLSFNGSGYCVHGIDTVEVKDIAQKIMEVIDKKRIESQTKKYIELLKLLTADCTKFVSWASSNERYNDIFSSQNPDLFWEKFVALPAKTFYKVGHWFDSFIISAQLLNHRETQIDFWRYILNKAKEYVTANIPEHTQRSKVFYLKKHFISNVENLLSGTSEK